jgi:hypothetical protein
LKNVYGFAYGRGNVVMTFDCLGETVEVLRKGTFTVSLMKGQLALHTAAETFLLPKKGPYDEYHLEGLRG